MKGEGKLAATANQSTQWPGNLGCLIREIEVIIRVEKPEAVRNDQMGFKFAERPVGNRKMVTELFVAQSPLALCDVRWNRNGRAPDLVGKAIQLFPRPCFRDSIDKFNQIDSTLPRDQIPITLSLRRVSF